jgi:hypothetical protein
MTSTQQNVARVPVFNTVAQTYVITFRNLGLILRLSWFWLLALTAALTALAWLLWPGHQAATKSGILAFPLLEVFGPPTLSLIAGSSIAVAWHRFVLLGEAPADRVYARVDKRILRYLGLAALSSLSIVAVMLPPFYGWEADAARDGIGSFLWRLLIAAFGAVVMFVASVRISPLLPALAIGRSDIGLRTVWRATSGNFWRLCCGGLLVGLPWIAGLIAMFAFSPDTTGQHTESFGEYLSTTIATEVLGVSFGMLAVTFLSLTFQHFFPSDAAQTSDQPRGH